MRKWSLESPKEKNNKKMELRVFKEKNNKKIELGAPGVSQRELDQTSLIKNLKGNP